MTQQNSDANQGNNQNDSANATDDPDLNDLLNESNDDDGNDSGDGNDSDDNNDSGDGQSLADVREEIRNELRSEFQSELDRRINQVVNTVRNERRNDSDSGSNSSNNDSGSSDNQPPTVTSEGRSTFREFLGDSIQRQSPEWGLALSIGIPALQNSVSNGENESAAAERLAKETATSLKDYRRQVERSLIAKLKKNGLLVQEGKPDSGGNSGSHNSAYAKGADKAKELGYGKD